MSIEDRMLGPFAGKHEFTAVLLVGHAAAYVSGSWGNVGRRRKEWLRALVAGDDVVVLDDYGWIYKTTVRAIEQNKRSGPSKEPRLWLVGHPSSYVAGRVWPTDTPICTDLLPEPPR